MKKKEFIEKRVLLIQFKSFITNIFQKLYARAFVSGLKQIDLFFEEKNLSLLPLSTYTEIKEAKDAPSINIRKFRK